MGLNYLEKMSILIKIYQKGPHFKELVLEQEINSILVLMFLIFSIQSQPQQQQ